jgi:hypothetical protein
MKCALEFGSDADLRLEEERPAASNCVADCCGKARRQLLRSRARSRLNSELSKNDDDSVDGEPRRTRSAPVITALITS